MVGICCMTGAMADPVIDWVTPPAWLQSPTQSGPARPGALVSGPVWISTGRGGKAVIVIGQERVELDENALWEWSGQDNEEVGNAVQGRVRVGPAIAGRQAAKSQRSDTTVVRLYTSAPWLLVLDGGENQSIAEGLSLFLKKSGYPVSAAQKMQAGSATSWEIWLDGFMSREAAVSIGKDLTALAPGIVSAKPKRKSTSIGN